MPTYDDVNRMTDPAFRDKDFDRLSDVQQVLDNQQSVLDDFDRGHDVITGAHPDQVVSNMAGYVSRAGLGVTPHPVSVGDVTFHLVFESGPNNRNGYIIRGAVGATLGGLYEVKVGFGGDREWCAFAAIRKIASSDP